MTEVQLFKNCKIDNINRVSSFSTLQEQNNYYEGLIVGGNGLKLEAINFQRLGDPMRINYKYDDIFEYCYGRIKLNDYWYYFSVNGLRVIQSEITEIGYRFDPWETTRLQFDAKLGRGYVERGKITDNNIKYWLPQVELQPRTVRVTTEPLAPLIQLKDPRPVGVGLSFLAITYVSSTGKKNINYIRPAYPGANTRVEILKYFSPSDILSQDSKNKNENDQFALSDVRGLWAIPFKYSSEERNVISGMTHIASGFKYWGNPPYQPYQKILSSMYDLFRVEEEEYTSPLDFKGENRGIQLPLVPETLDTTRRYITDMRGAEVFTAPYGRKITRPLRAMCDITYSSCKYIAWFGDNEHDMRFTIPCEPIPIMADSYNEYTVRQRMTDIESRRIARNQQLAQGISSSLTSAATGGILGSIGASPGSGMGRAGVGAGVSGGAGIAEAVAGYAIDRYYGHQQQAMTDNHFKHQKDELLLHGDAEDSLRDMQLVTEDWDEYSKTRFNNYIAVNGYHVHHALPDCSTFYIPGGTLKGDFDIDGNMPENWKKQIRERFSTGVRIIQ